MVLTAQAFWECEVNKTYCVFLSGPQGNKMEAICDESHVSFILSVSELQLFVSFVNNKSFHVERMCLNLDI